MFDAHGRVDWSPSPRDDLSLTFRRVRAEGQVVQTAFDANYSNPAGTDVATVQKHLGGHGGFRWTRSYATY